MDDFVTLHAPLLWQERSKTMIKKLLGECRETFSDIWLWTTLCVIGCIPFPGIMLAYPILSILKTVLRAIYLEPIARYLCNSMYQDDYYADLVAIDLIRVWIISYVFITLFRISYVCYENLRKAINN